MYCKAKSRFVFSYSLNWFILRSALIFQGDGDDEVAARGFFVGGSQAGPGFTLKF